MSVTNILSVQHLSPNRVMTRPFLFAACAQPSRAAGLNEMPIYPTLALPVCIIGVIGVIGVSETMAAMAMRRPVSPHRLLRAVFLGTSVLIVEAHNVVFAEIAARLNLDDFERRLARILQTMLHAQRNIGGFVLG